MERESHLKIWRVVQKIPKGKILSYGKVADLAGLPGRARLVGKCLGLVPNDGVDGCDVPWHRVLRSSGEIAFANGSDCFEQQRSLLIAEGVLVKGRRVSLKEFEWRPDLSELLYYLTE